MNKLEGFVSQVKAVLSLFKVSPFAEGGPSRGTRRAESRPFLFVIAVATLVLSSASVHGQYVERVDVSVANIDVVVTDGKGNPVRGLVRDDFELYEDGKLQEITNFSAIEAAGAETPVMSGVTSTPSIAASQPPPPRLIVIFIDIDDIEPIRRRQFFEGLGAFLDSAFREGDLVTILTWNHRVRVLMPPTSSRAQVEALIQVFARTYRWSESEITRRASEARVLEAERDAAFARSIGMGNVLDPEAEALFQEWVVGEERCATIRRKARELRNLITSLVRAGMQKTLIFASDDLSLRPTRDCDTRGEIDALADAANAYGMTIHAFHPPGVRGSGVVGADRGDFMPRANDPAPMRKASGDTFDQFGGLLLLAGRTGGLSGLGAAQSASVLEQAAAELDTHYSIGYRFSSGNEDRPRNVRVTTKNRAYRVRARQSVVRLSETARLRDELTANLYLPPQHQSQSPEFQVRIDRIARDGRFSFVHLELSISARDLVALSSADEKKRGSFSVFVVAGRELGDASPVAELERDFEAVTGAEDSRVIYQFATRVRPDTRRLSIAVRDNMSGEVATKVVMLTPQEPKGSPLVDAQTAPSSALETASEPATDWQEAVGRAGAEEKLIVALSGPETCPDISRRDPCRDFAAITSHPAMRRRLSSVVFLTGASTAPQESAVSIFDPAGNLVIRWTGVPDLQEFQHMLDLIEVAAPFLSDAYRAAVRQNQPEQLRAMALAMLALSQPSRGRELLEALRSSTALEDQQFASLWLEQLDAHSSKREPGEELLTDLARNGTTDLVQLNAWLALGNLRYQQSRYEEAADAYRMALELAPEKQKKAALAALQKAEAMVSPIAGLDSPGSIIAGRQNIRPRVVDEGTAKVEYRLDGRLVATADQPPFATTVNFGGIGKRRMLELTTRDRAGHVKERSTVVVNRKSDEFSVRIVEPSSSELSGSVDVNVMPLVPYGRSVESVVVEWNGVQVVRLTSPPYRTRVDVNAGEQGILRAAVRLDDGSEVEDVLLANAGAMTLASEVNLVEVPVYVETGALTLNDLSVKEGVKQRTVDRVIAAGAAPLRIALVLDASSSMGEHILDVQEAAIRFVETQLEDRDQVMMVAFNDATRIVWPTNDRSRIERSILAIQPRGGTPLRDAMITGLLQIPYTGSRRALVVFSDGMDTGSEFSLGDVNEVAGRSGVPIYVLSLRPPIGSPARWAGRGTPIAPSDLHTRHSIVSRAQAELKNLSRTTGGKMFDLGSLEDLTSIWAEIGEDLRKQSLVIYRTEPSGSEWRPIEVSIKGGGRLRAPAGVYVAGEAKEAP